MTIIAVKKVINTIRFWFSHANSMSTRAKCMLYWQASEGGLPFAKGFFDKMLKYLIAFMGVRIWSRRPLHVAVRTFVECV